MRCVEAGGAAIDSGPTVFTMRWVFEQIFAGAGAVLDERLKLSPLPVLARHAWRDGSRLDLFADHERSVDAIGDFAGAAEAKRFRAFCGQARDVYDALEGPYIRSSRPSLVGMGTSLGMRGMKELVKLGPFTSLASNLARQFADPRLRQLFGRYATYCGSSPWSAPATLLLVAQVEMDGVWSVDGGMHGLACAIAALAVERGVSIRYGTPVGAGRWRPDRCGQRRVQRRRACAGQRLSRRGGCLCGRPRAACRALAVGGDLVDACAHGWLPARQPQRVLR
jgi:1-hydroxycarotenoid 3,4-desaturase